MGQGGGAGAAARSELGLRVRSSVVLGAAALLTAWTGGWILAVVWIFAADVVAAEWLALTGAEPRQPLLGLAVGGLALVQLAFVSRADLTALALGAAGLLAAALLARTGRDRAWAVTGLLYATAIAIVPVALRTRLGWGPAPLLWLFAVVWTTDVAAYFAGRAAGGPRLWPAVSPKKTWSGFAGGLAAGTLAGAAVAAIAIRLGAAIPLEVATVAAISAVASVASQAGDLAESAMKRRFGAKDSGSIIPGHGGAMDRLDGFAAVSILLGAALAGAVASGWPARP